MVQLGETGSPKLDRDLSGLLQAICIRTVITRIGFRGIFYSIAIRKNPRTNEVGSPGRCGLGVPGYRVYRLLVGLELRDQKP